MSRATHEYLTDAELAAWHGCLEFTSAALRALDEALMRAHRISVKEFDVLITLYNAPGKRLRMAQLADEVLLSPAGVSHMVTRLEKAGLVRRSVDDADRRSLFATLTPDGDRRLRDSRPTHNQVVRAHLTERLSDAQLAALGRLWRTVLPR
ncbi:MAG TPA: MarR family transcriptional regulator [Acidimicrobiales bacterium]|nr:MarR family transcriptional regulator [Acidimicrobiales bacterium]